MGLEWQDGEIVEVPDVVDADLVSTRAAIASATTVSGLRTAQLRLADYIRDNKIDI